MTFIEKIQNAPESITFQETMGYIDENYHFTPAWFTNGQTVNEAGQNNGSCKIFSFAKLKRLNTEQTLNLFGDFYRKDVLQNPAGSDHLNIRNFIQTGWGGISFESTPLSEK